MARLTMIALALLAIAAVAAAQGPCIECKDCRTGNCWQQCRPSCPRPIPPPIRPNNVIVSGDACQRAGRASAGPVMTSACATTRKYCSGGRSGVGSTRRVGPTTLAQCANIALGSCQQVANNPWTPSHPCGREIQRGMGSCTPAQFKAFYEGETRDLCTNQARSITGVEPGTNNWARPPTPWGGVGSSQSG